MRNRTSSPGEPPTALQVMSPTGLRNSNMADATPSGRVGLAQVSRSNQLKSNQVQVPIQNALTSHGIGGARGPNLGTTHGAMSQRCRATAQTPNRGVDERAISVQVSLVERALEGASWLGEMWQAMMQTPPSASTHASDRPTSSPQRTGLATPGLGEYLEEHARKQCHAMPGTGRQVLTIAPAGRHGHCASNGRDHEAAIINQLTPGSGRQVQVDANSPAGRYGCKAVRGHEEEVRRQVADFMAQQAEAMKRLQDENAALRERFNQSAAQQLSIPPISGAVEPPVSVPAQGGGVLDSSTVQPAEAVSGAATGAPATGMNLSSLANAVPGISVPALSSAPPAGRPGAMQPAGADSSRVCANVCSATPAGRPGAMQDSQVHRCKVPRSKVPIQQPCWQDSQRCKVPRSKVARLAGLLGAQAQGAQVQGPNPAAELAGPFVGATLSASSVPVGAINGLQEPQVPCFAGSMPPPPQAQTPNPWLRGSAESDLLSGLVTGAASDPLQSWSCAAATAQPGELRGTHCPIAPNISGLEDDKGSSQGLAGTHVQEEAPQQIQFACKPEVERRMMPSLIQEQPVVQWPPQGVESAHASANPGSARQGLTSRDVCGEEAAAGFLTAIRFGRDACHRARCIASREGWPNAQCARGPSPCRAETSAQVVTKV